MKMRLQVFSKRSQNLLLSCFVMVIFLISQRGHAFYLDGKGHYAIRGETLTNPGFSKSRGMHQGFNQSFSLDGEARFNDQSSFFLDLGLFDKDESSYLGDTAKPSDCAPRRDPITGEIISNCDGRVQDQDMPGYKNRYPFARGAYIRYAFDYCILEAGRRPRNWGMGILHSSGKKPFTNNPSYFDGASCILNPQKSQTIGFSVGYDKLQETGESFTNPYDYPIPDIAAQNEYQPGSYGTGRSSDDIDQIYFSLEYDDRSEKSSSSFAKNIGIYFSNSWSSKSANSVASDVKFLDLFTALYFPSFTFRNEFVFRMGRSGAPQYVELGGARLDEDLLPTRNNVDTLAFAGDLVWTMSQNGAYVGPKEFRQGNYSEHLLKFEYAFAPGDADSYYVDEYNKADPTQSQAYVSKRDKKATAFQFHPNYKPALILFNGMESTSDLNFTKGGFYDDRLVNVMVYTLGYHYNSVASGDFGVKLISAKLLNTAPAEMKDVYLANAWMKRPVGYGSNNLGHELDLMYKYHWGRDVNLGVAIAYAMAGDAWDVEIDKSPSDSFLLQSQISFSF